MSEVPNPETHASEDTATDNTFVKKADVEGNGTGFLHENTVSGQRERLIEARKRAEH